MQKIIVMGFVGSEVEERFTADGKRIRTFPLGINVYKKGEKFTVWYRINCWEGIGLNVLPFLRKGLVITVIGDINPPTTYQTQKGDIKIHMPITCNSISLVPLPEQKKWGKEKDDTNDRYGDRV